MMVRGIRVSQWLKPRSVERLVRRALPGTSARIRPRGGSGRPRAYVLWFSGHASDAEMRALANEIEAGVPAKAAVTIECRRHS
jgi:hypothetical protein